MLDLKNIIEKTEEIKEKLKNRNVDLALIEKVKTISKKRTNLMIKLQNLESKRNKISKEIGFLKGQKKDVTNELSLVAKIKDEIGAIKDDEVNVNKIINDLLLSIPNVPLDDVPRGKTENDNVVINEYIIGRGEIKDVVPHYEIGVALGLVDFKRAVKLSGTRFWSYKGKGAKLIRALENFMLDLHGKSDFKELRLPLIVKSDTLVGTGQLPKFAEDLFKIEGMDSYLIPTAEVPITNYFKDEIMDFNKPTSFTAYTPCFRSEAGSAGKDTKGLIRAHQFNKVELVKFTNEENWEKDFKNTLEQAKKVLELLKLPYRELLLCDGDTGFSARKTIDLEVWIPSEQKYREISSVSFFGDYQARRAKIRYRDAENKSKYVMTINGSALALDRAMAAILENYQEADGSITIPDVLVPYMNGEVKLVK